MAGGLGALIGLWVSRGGGVDSTLVLAGLSSLATDENWDTLRAYSREARRAKTARRPRSLTPRAGAVSFASVHRRIPASGGRHVEPDQPQERPHRVTRPHHTSRDHPAAPLAAQAKAKAPAAKDADPYAGLSLGAFKLRADRPGPDLGAHRRTSPSIRRNKPRVLRRRGLLGRRLEDR
ncbi:MAG: hypothetical protein MZV70_70425 [Desulfobacterales bacterium]|nr:hypothetical protein [Desulfobacterales bacterium]